MNDRACRWGGCNGVGRPGGVCNRCGTPIDFPGGEVPKRCRHCGSEEHDSYDCPHAEEFVYCDDACRAKANPETPEEVRAAYVHWRLHHACGGCSHNR